MDSMQRSKRPRWTMSQRSFSHSVRPGPAGVVATSVVGRRSWGVDQAQYVRLVRELPEVSPKRMTVRTALPFCGRAYLRRFSVALTELVRQLRDLQPPPSDAADIENHFIEPLELLAEFAGEMAKTSPPWLGFGGALKLMTERGPKPTEADLAFTQAYGLVDGPGQ
jgi:hypothetical protein